MLCHDGVSILHTPVLGVPTSAGCSAAGHGAGPHNGVMR
jgi:hypothetical protein